MKRKTSKKPDFLDDELERFAIRIWRNENAGGDPLIKLDLMRFLYRNPSSIDSAPNLALRIGRNMEKVDAALSDLVNSDVVVPRGEIWGSMFYSLTDDSATLNSIGRFFQVCYRSKETITAFYFWLGLTTDNIIK